MKITDIPGIRLLNQQISESRFKTAKDLVGWMGAMQAQDFTMAKWAIGIRMPGSTDAVIESAIDNGEIFRTHVLRPTWHFVSPEDIYWMLELTAPKIRSSIKSMHKELELTEKIFKKSNSIIEKALQGGKHLTREELVKEFNKAKIVTNTYRAAHLMLNSELDGVVCNGIKKGSKQTYSLLAERMPKTKTFNRDEALSQLARRYFTSHCPATLQDFTWWSGLPAADARQALENVKPEFISEKSGDQTYWMTNSFSVPKKSKSSVYFLPAYDEFMISYKDRSASLSPSFNKDTITINGIFKPVLVINGQVKALWKRTIRKDKLTIEIEFFDRPAGTIKGSLEKAARAYGDFLGKKTEIDSESV